MNDRQGTYFRDGKLTVDGTDARAVAQRAIKLGILTPYTGPSIEDIRAANKIKRAKQKAAADRNWDEKRARQLAD